LNRDWYVVRARAELPGVRFHDLRHAFVTLLLDMGVQPHIVQAIAGHSGIEVTMTVYAHASDQEKRAALRGLDERLG
jgi:integrase